MILDLYAGAGGWSIGADTLELTSVGLELEHDPCVTAVRAGHPRIRCDVATYPTEPFVGRIVGLTASPPCQAWSTAGKRLGEHDRATVHDLVDAYAAGAGADAWRTTEWADQRSHHAAQPVRWIRDLQPDWVCLEQVPRVLGLWRHIVRVLRGWGYSAWCGVLNTADYGVPQTRRRAILIASRTRLVNPPEPTHARVATADLFGERVPWVSMAEALGWGEGASVGLHRGAGVIERYGPRPLRVATLPAPTIRAGGDGGGCGTNLLVHQQTDQWVLRSPHHAKANDRTQPRRLDEPAPTVAFGHSDMTWVAERDGGGGETRRLTLAEAAVLQSFPRDYPWAGTKTSRFQQIGNAIPPRLAAAIINAARGTP